MQTIKKTTLALGLTVVAMLVTIAPSAMAVGPRWGQCTKSAEGGYENESCTKEKAKGGFEWTELTATEEVTSSGEIELEDTKATGGAVAIKCSENDTGWVAASGEDGISTVTNLKCTSVKEGQCKKIVSVEPRNLPWGTRLVEIGSETRDELISGSSGGAPGWRIACETILGKTEDTCERSGTTQGVKSNSKTGAVELVFDKKTEGEKANCSIGGKESGRVSGTITIKSKNGAGLRDLPLWEAGATRPNIANIGGRGNTRTVNIGIDPITIRSETLSANLKLIGTSGCLNVELKKFGDRCESTVERIAAGATDYKYRYTSPLEGKTEKESGSEE